MQSVKRPGVTMRRAATMRKTPSSISATGGSPRRIASSARRHVVSPCIRSSVAPMSAVPRTMPMVGHTPIAPPTSMKMAISISGMAMKARKKKAGKTGFRRCRGFMEGFSPWRAGSASQEGR